LGLRGFASGANHCIVPEADYSDATLVLVGHGSTLNADSSQPVFRHAAELRRRNLFADVREGFWKQAPCLAEVLRGISSPRVFVVPLCVSEGYLTQEVIPRELGLCAPGETEFRRVQKRGEQTLHYCGPIGTHESMTGVLLARARSIVAQNPFPLAPSPRDIALFVAGHGTTRNENSRRAIERQVELLRALNLYAEVHAVFLEEDPRVGDCYRIARAKNIVLLPFFISDGLHSREDIPVLLGESERVVQERVSLGQPTWRNPTERQAKRAWYAASIGNEAHIPDVILERVREQALTG